MNNLLWNSVAADGIGVEAESIKEHNVKNICHSIP
jgi:hypothetical protein